MLAIDHRYQNPGFAGSTRYDQSNCKIIIFSPAGRLVKSLGGNSVYEYPTKLRGHLQCVSKLHTSQIL